ncbi:phage tail spike protein [Eggerthella guodeyinii]|uniref:phage tail spike protein n=1 Tax=Eggerthella guodeyinii TaxID=2690837 RepID=UPI0018A237E1|nr:phage tail spike protein [Eggerthella guodeyinii]
MAVVKVPGFTRFDRWGENLGRLAVTEAVHKEALDGTDELKITCYEDLSKGERVVWVDRRGVCHEHIVDEPSRTHDDEGEPTTTATCINSISELWDDYIEDKRPSGGVAVALASILQGTRWDVGTCDQKTSASHTFYHVSAREALAELLDVWGGELETVVEHDGARVTRRRVSVRAMRGNQRSAKRFTWTKDLISITRKVASDNPKTRVYGYGKGVETEGGGYGRRLTFESVNGGRGYVEDAEATAIWGHPDGSGGIAPAVGTYVNEQCEDERQLLAETNAYLEEAKEPKVAYTADVDDLAASGKDWEDVGLGDSVAILDKGFCDAGIRLRGRVSQTERDLLTNDTTATFGNVADAMADMWQSVAQALKSSSAKSALFDAVAGTSPGWLVLLQGALNEQFDKAGSYQVETFELGTIWSNVPLDGTTGRPAKKTSSMWAININGRGFRIASGLASDGSWDWSTFGTGEGFTADAINAGTMNADLIRAGTITDAAGENFWDLETGEMRISASASVGGGAMGDAVTGADVQFGVSDSAAVQPTSWSTNALWQQGKHLWTRTKMTLADGSTAYTAPRRIANDKGIGIAQVTEQYYLSTSSTTQAGGSWLNAQPAWVKGRYYWTRSRVAWSDGSITYTDPVLARALTSGNQAADDLDDELTQREIFNRLTNNGETQGLYISAGKLYINATYLKTGIISDALGRNKWNLGTGALSTNYMTASNITASGTMSTGYDTSYMAKLTGGKLKFYYNGAETIELVSIPSYTSGEKGGYIQACNGATYLGLRAPKLYTALNTSEAGTIGYTGTIKQKVSSGGHIGTFELRVINGIVVSYNAWNYE